MAPSEALERWNTHFETVVQQTVFDVQLSLAQDPSSFNLGTTVWDASIVLAKWLEKNARKGELSWSRVKGRTVVELGAGMGLAGMTLALMGANVIFTDITDPVLDLLRRNVETNISRAALSLNENSWVLDRIGNSEVIELDWAQPEHFSRIINPVDIIVAADCVYSEKAVPHFYETVMALANRKTTIVIANEFRCERVHEMFMSLFGEFFTIKKIPANKMDESYRHPLIHIYVLKKRKESSSKLCHDLQNLECQTKSHEAEGGHHHNRNSDEHSAKATLLEEREENYQVPDSATQSKQECLDETKKISSKIELEEAEHFKARRQGSELARLMKNIQLE